GAGPGPPPVSAAGPGAPPPGPLRAAGGPAKGLLARQHVQGPGPGAVAGDPGVRHAGRSPDPPAALKPIRDIAGAGRLSDAHRGRCRTKPPRACRPPVRRSFRPMLQPLEDRTLLSVTIAPTNNNGQGFQGLDFNSTEGYAPPDSQGAAGPSVYVE